VIRGLIGMLKLAKHTRFQCIPRSEPFLLLTALVHISTWGCHFEVYEEGREGEGGRRRGRRSFTLVCVIIMKHGESVGYQRIVGLCYYVYSIKLCFSSTSNVLFTFRLLPALKFVSVKPKPTESQITT